MQVLGKAGPNGPQSMKDLKEPRLRDLKRKIHTTIRDVTRDIDREKQFNTAVARLMELLNALASFKAESDEEQQLIREGVEVLLSCLNPFCPHITEELWEMTGHGEPLAKLPWPLAEEDALEADTVTVVVQINGKVREKAEFPAGLGEEALKKMALELPGVGKRIEGLEIVRIITVPDRLVNVVVKG